MSLVTPDEHGKLHLHRIHTTSQGGWSERTPRAPHRTPAVKPGNCARPDEAPPPLLRSPRCLLSPKVPKTVQRGLLPEKEDTFNQPGRTRKNSPFESEAAHGSVFSSVKLTLRTPLICNGGRGKLRYLIDKADSFGHRVHLRFNVPSR